MIKPSFLSLPIYAFELSDKSYKYLRLKSTALGMMLEEAGEGEIPARVLEHGEIKQPEILTAILAELFAKKKIRFAAISLPEEKGYLRNIKLAGIKEEEIEEALKLQLEEQVPLPPPEIVFNYNLVKDHKDHFDVVLVAFSKNLVNSYLDIFSKAGAIPVWVDSELAASVEAVVPRTFDKTAMLMDWGKTRVSFAIAENRVLRFASTVQVGGDTMDEAISKSLGVDLKKAEELQKETGFNEKTGDRRIFQALLPIVASMKEEAEKYMLFWQTHSEEKQIPSKLFLSGGDANLIGLKSYLQKELGLEVATADPWVNIKFPPKYVPEIEKKDSVRFSSAIGLGLYALKKEMDL